jgi:hypothetical protein
MRTIFTSEDVKGVIDDIFNGNLAQFKATNGLVEYLNPNSEKVLLIDEETGERTEADLAQFLNIQFYSWHNRLVSEVDNPIDKLPKFSVFETWVKSLNFSMDNTYALVETVDEQATVSQDIDNAVKIGRVTFLVNENKVSNLDYYVSKLRNKFLGVAQEIQNSFGDKIDAYVTIGTLLYDQEPFMSQVGKVMVVSCNFKINYLAEALNYGDTKIEISLDGDDFYNTRGEIVGLDGEPAVTKYKTMPITKLSFQNIFSSNPLATWDRPDLTGFLSTSLSTAKTISFYDFKNQKLTKEFNKIFWEKPAYRINGLVTERKDVNIPVFLRITSDGVAYTYKDVIDNMQKVITNGDFNISSITLKGWAKLPDDPAYLFELTFDSNGGSEVDTKKMLIVGQTVGQLPTPQRVGFTFDGWFVNNELIRPNSVWQYDNDAVAVARWKPIFNVNWDSYVVGIGDYDYYSAFVTMDTEVPNGEIYYTDNGSIPIKGEAGTMLYENRLFYDEDAPIQEREIIATLYSGNEALATKSVTIRYGKTPNGGA